MTAGAGAGDGSGAEALDAFFAGHPEARSIAAAVAEVVEELGPHTVRVSRSQVAFRRRRAFAWLWRPGQYVRSTVPVVLSLSLPQRDGSPRWKEVVQPSPHAWMHHLELNAPEEVDGAVRDWLATAYDAAG
ncbi:DUF5655 domain-containing protein [Knoellia aerolata]|uniref:DUF5655 domain-containing protein n=1 Tax=Knoellia aerolata DSM 18566 TaxID=1385519 RepID=A0A0A0JZJ3_9MICO|nr:DUF5655 domain-containing protein [Knoellia aerolata]KGN40956.1 hypothetical protein N801_10215 [Knoellia aerolata DSM 18566]